MNHEPLTRLSHPWVRGAVAGTGDDIGRWRVVPAEPSELIWRGCDYGNGLPRWAVVPSYRQEDTGGPNSCPQVSR